ncbi:ABC transporter ATP-binding protein [Natrialba sp. INN-245]|uniref:ABC transporter ATP-binding protein n=1 Tax=Natrialba sp. INN-245 TaxID=2690967 RepID=UPI0013136CA1|nr:ABC transporter ATP-binding protein [Natrialba sp. INN-245]MWV38471.1 ATP-binding cassette domain-containing protein [Natrialba sp. INN-245]
MSDDPLLEVENLTVQYKTKEGMLTAVSDASFGISEGEYFGVVGESGCGKSTLLLSILNALDSNGQVTNGVIRYKGEEIQDMSEQELNRRIRWKEIAYIPQGSMNSLDPLERISTQAVQLADLHSDLDEQEALTKFEEMFEIVGIDPERIHDYPHQFSGGMKQRAIIALALFLEPSLIIADEPTTALDVIMQDQIFKHIDDIVDRVGTSIMLITHDIAVVFESCDRMAVMHGGQIAEVGPVTRIDNDPHHPYSTLLQEAFPDIREPDRDLSVIEGKPPRQIGETDYCTFVDRCPWAIEECREAPPPLERAEADRSDHFVSCFRKDDIREENEQGTDDRKAPNQKSGSLANDE